MKHTIENLIRSFQGYSYEIAGILTAYFDDPVQARNCANEIAEAWRKPVQVTGTSVTIYM